MKKVNTPPTRLRRDELHIIDTDYGKKTAYITGMGQTLVNLHRESDCAGEFCVIHRPSDHNMRHLPTNFRSDKGQMERICRHGVGHPDPDDLDWHKRNGREWMAVHGCCGCCGDEETIGRLDVAG